MLRFGLRDTKCGVTLHARVWIEIVRNLSISAAGGRHPPREGVD